MSHIPLPFPSDSLTAAILYRDALGMAVHPLHSRDDQSVPEKARGKKPLLANWKTWTPAAATDELLTRYFGNGLRNNVGVVLQPGQVVVDLDSKKDRGDSVRRWLKTKPELKGVPCEQTGGGVHLHFRCENLPAITRGGRRYDKPLVVTINDAVTAELHSAGHNLAVAPSVHVSGAKYEWIVAGEVPQWPWEQLCTVFGFQLPAGTKVEKITKAEGKPDGFARFKGDLCTLDIVKLTKRLRIYGQPVNTGKHCHTVKCPWHDQHSGTTEWDPADTSTAVFEARDIQRPAFKCLHATHGDKSFLEVLTWCDEQEPGVVDGCCTRMWEGSSQSAGNGDRPRLLLPGPYRPDSEFARDCGSIIGPKHVWFRKGDQVVEVREKIFTDKVRHLAFHPLRPVEVCTAIEDFIEVGTVVTSKEGGKMFMPVSMSDKRANVLINSPQFKRELPQITRVLDYQIPIIHGSQLIFPARGFDPRFGIYTNPGAPEMVEMDPRTAMMWLRELLKDFCFDGEQSLTHAIARLLTPMCRAMMGWDARGPFWIYTANRERLGKDYLAVIAGLLFDGYPNEDAPLEPHNATETRKRITSAMIAGRNRMHFANCSGHINDSALEQAITSKCWSDRLLGSSTDLSLPNEIEFSMSGNAGVVTYRGDLAHRARHIRLYYAEENPNQRKFTQPRLHQWVQQNRANLLSALAVLVRNWYAAGQPEGKAPFASYPEWAATVGGVMGLNGLGEPCLAETMTQVGGDEEARDMKTLFHLAHTKWGLTRVEQKRIIALIVENEAYQLFGWLDLSARQGQTSFGKMLRRYDGRVLEGIVLKIHSDTTRPKFSFERWEADSAASTNPVDRLLKLATPVRGADIADIADILHPKSLLPNPDAIQAGKQEEGPGGIGWEKVRNVRDVRSITPLTEPAELTEIAAAISKAAAPVALDIETYGNDTLNPYRGEIRLLTLSIPGRGPWLLDLKAMGYDLGPLKPALETALIIGHNLKFDLLWLRVKCGLRVQRLFCTMTAARLLHAGTRQENDLGSVIECYLDATLAQDQGRSDWGRERLTPEQIQYAGEDVIHLHRLRIVLERELEEAGLVRVAQLEMDLLPAVVDMEAAGFAVDRNRLETLLADSEREAREAETETKALFMNPAINLSSPAQLVSALTGMGIEVEDTKAETLATLDTPAIKPLVRFREAETQARLLRKLLASIETDGRIHARFNPTGTATGRFSSSAPNLQNVSRGPTRSCFIAAPGCRLVIADYSQIELRAAAVLAGETKMLEAFQQGDDLHLKTAELVLGRKATAQDRQLAKAVNFGLLYGQNAEGLASYAGKSYGVSLSPDDALSIRRKFFSGYEELERWHKAAWTAAAGDAYQTRTRLGRRRLLADAGDHKWKRFTTLVNTPVQGGCADGMKLAMLKLSRNLPKEAKMISCVHDELIVETTEATAEDVKKLVTETMVFEMQSLFPEVPIEVEARISTTWGGKGEVNSAAERDGK